MRLTHTESPAATPTIPRRNTNLTETAGFALPLEQHEDVTLLHGSLHVTDDLASGVVDELHLHLGHVTGAAGASKHPAKQNKLI